MCALPISAKWSRSKQGTPQGGVISPLLANVYLHWFDKLFHRADGPARWADAKLVRYADDFVVLARYQSKRLTGWIEEKIEKWLGLEINRDKTRVVDLKCAFKFLRHGSKSESGLSGLHVSLAPRPLWPQAAISACGAGEEVGAEGAASASRTDGSPSGMYADYAPDQSAESPTGRIGELLQVGLPARSVPEYQLANLHVRFAEGTGDRSLAASHCPTLLSFVVKFFPPQAPKENTPK